MVLHLGMTDCSQENTVKGSQLIQAVHRHHTASAKVRLATPIEMGPREVNAVATASRFEHTDALGYDFAADSIPRDDCDLVLLFGRTFSHRVLAYFPQSATSFRASSTRSSARTRSTTVSAFCLGQLANAALLRNLSATSSYVMGSAGLPLPKSARPKRVFPFFK